MQNIHEIHEIHEMQEMQDMQEMQEMQEMQGAVAGSAGEQRQKQRRRRTRQACGPCRQKKVKCDGAFPCDYCRRCGRECTPPYNPQTHPVPRPIAPSASPAAGPAVQQMLLQPLQDQQLQLGPPMIPQPLPVDFQHTQPVFGPQLPPQPIPQPIPQPMPKPMSQPMPKATCERKVVLQPPALSPEPSYQPQPPRQRRKFKAEGDSKTQPRKRREIQELRDYQDLQDLDGFENFDVLQELEGLDELEALEQLQDFDQPPSKPTLALPRQLNSIVHMFGQRELRFVDIYFKFCHTHVPVVTKQQLKEALMCNTLPAHQLGPTEMARTSAFLANAWAAAAIGASFYDPDGTIQCINLAMQHIRACFDNPTPETIRAYFALCEAYYRLDTKDVQTWAKYVGFANVLEAELSDRLSPEVRALFDYYRTILRNNTTAETYRIEYNTRRTFVQSNDDESSEGQLLELVTLSIQHTFNLVRGRNLDQAELRRQTELFLPPLERAHRRLIESGHIHTQFGLRYYTICVFLIHFNAKLGRLDEVVKYLRHQVPMHEVIPFYRWPRSRRWPFLTMCVLEALGCTDLVQVIRNVVEAGSARWDGFVEYKKLDEALWVDTYLEVVKHRALQEQPQQYAQQYAQSMHQQQPFPDPEWIYDETRIWHPAIFQRHYRPRHRYQAPQQPPQPQQQQYAQQQQQQQQPPHQQYDQSPPFPTAPLQYPPPSPIGENPFEPSSLDEQLLPRIYELPLDALLPASVDINADGIVETDTDSSSRDVTYEILQPNDYADLAAFFADCDL